MFTPPCILTLPCKRMLVRGGRFAPQDCVDDVSVAMVHHQGNLLLPSCRACQKRANVATFASFWVVADAAQNLAHAAAYCIAPPQSSQQTCATGNLTFCPAPARLGARATAKHDTSTTRAAARSLSCAEPTCQASRRGEGSAKGTSLWAETSAPGLHGRGIPAWTHHVVAASASLGPYRADNACTEISRHRRLDPQPCAHTVAAAPSPTEYAPQPGR